MDLREARRLLGMEPQDDVKEMKARFRTLIRRYHPDALGADSPEQAGRAQELNEAYRLLKIHYLSRAAGDAAWAEPETPPWEAPVNPAAYAERTVFVPYTLDAEAVDLRQAAAAGRYLWEPEEEIFSDFLRSLAALSKELLMEQEPGDSGMFSASELSALRFRYQVPLLYLLAQQFVDPLMSLGKLAEPRCADREGRPVYGFRAFLSAKSGEAHYRAVSGLAAGEILYPAALKDNRIYVQTAGGTGLGHLSFAGDALYFCLIPLLKEKRAQMKLTVKRTELRRKHRPFENRAEAELLLRVDGGTPWRFPEGTNGKIQTVLRKYRESLGPEGDRYGAGTKKSRKESIRYE